MKPVDPFLQLNLRSTGKRPGDTRGQQLSVQIGLRGRAALAAVRAPVELGRRQKVGKCSDAEAVIKAERR